MQSFVCSHCGKFNSSKSLICAYCLKINKIRTEEDSLSFSLENSLTNLSITYNNPRKTPKVQPQIKDEDFLIDGHILDTQNILEDVFKTPFEQKPLSTLPTKPEKLNTFIVSKNDEFLHYFIPKFEEANFNMDLFELPDYITKDQAFNLVFSFPGKTKKESIVSYYGNNVSTINLSRQLNHTSNLTYVLLAPLTEETIRSLYSSFLKHKGKFRFMIFNDISKVFMYFCNIIKKVQSGFNFREENLELELLKTIKTEKIKMNVFDILNIDKATLNKTEKEEMKIKNSYFKMLNQIEGINEARAKVIFSEFGSFRTLIDFFKENGKDSSISKLGDIRIGNTKYSKRIGTAQAEKLYDYFN
eukprot:GAHX01001913.1.p1 GENE.GAHX01001913.1~~GAHX01001913.1.p1  ORF type:complete len:358 (+),score=77.69 GAHX01001913.1:205-1278(+)